MCASEFFIGIDVSKDHLDIAGLPDQKIWQIKNDPDGHEQLAHRLLPLSLGRIVMEATGGYEMALCALLRAKGLPAVVVNARQVRDYAKACGILAKTDPIDAHVIADFAQKINPQVRPLPSEQTRQLADLVARRRQILAMMHTEHNRLPRVSLPVS